MVLPCGCTPDKSGYGYCGECTRKLREKIWRNMSPKKKAYDRHFDPKGSAAMDRALEAADNGDYDGGCSCHINPPCGYCVNKEPCTESMD